RLLRNTVSYDDFNSFKEELLSHIHQGLEVPRNQTEILAVLDELFDKVWYNRHQFLRQKVEVGEITIAPDIWKGALKAAKRIERRYRSGVLGPWGDFEWGMINGKLSALRWVLGDEWDMLDT
ncbi:unnamed protein product, partial [marine sediment metagenome]